MGTAEREYIVFDIETVGVDFDSLSEAEREYLLKNKDRFNESEEDIKAKLGFWALTGHVVSLAMFKPMKGTLLLLYLSSERLRNHKDSFEGYRLVREAYPIRESIEEAEREILKVFWEKISESEDGRWEPKLISFNGRNFDIPFLMLRSVALGIEVSRALAKENRFSHDNHLDLADLITLYGAGRKYSLDFICRRLGIRSPKEDGIDGGDIQELFKKGEYERIAEYNLRDVLAIAELYERVRASWGSAFGNL